MSYKLMQNFEKARPLDSKLAIRKAFQRNVST